MDRNPGRDFLQETAEASDLVDDNLVPKYKRCKYYFELHTDDEIWYYFEDGFLTKEQNGDGGKDASSALPSHG